MSRPRSVSFEVATKRIRGFRNQDIMEELNRWAPISGDPQGTAIDPLITNVYLHELDVEMCEARLAIVRYPDDTVVLCRSRKEAQAALALLRAWVSGN